MFKNSEFEIWDYEAIEFNQSDNPEMNFMNRDNVAQGWLCCFVVFLKNNWHVTISFYKVVVLNQKSTNRPIIVANCHILFNESRGEIKLGQVSESGKKKQENL